MSFFISGACIVSELSAQGGVNEKTQHKYANIKKTIKYSGKTYFSFYIRKNVLYIKQ